MRRDLRKEKNRHGFSEFRPSRPSHRPRKRRFGLELQGIDKKERRKKAMEKLKLVGLEKVHVSMIGELSGGMQQRGGYVSWAEGIAMDWMQKHNGLINSWL